MTTTLRLHIDAAWPDAGGTPWALLDDHGALLDRGRGEPGQWPAADDHEAVLSADQSAWLRGRMPDKVPRGEEARLIAYALEDRLLREADSQHFTVTGRSAGEVAVLVTARNRLTRIIDAFAALDRPLSRLCSALQTAPAGDDGWHATLEDERLILRPAPDRGLVWDLGPDTASPPAALLRLRAAAGGSEDKAPPLIIHDRRTAGSGPVAWDQVLVETVTVAAPGAWHQGWERANNLLEGAFAPRHRRRAWLAPLKPAAALAVLALTADLVLDMAQTGWWRYQAARLDGETVQQFHGAFPHTPAVDPPAQVQRQLDLLRAARGQLRSDDALSLLAAVTEALGGDGADALASLRYEAGRLELGFASGKSTRASAVAAALAARGLPATLQPTAGGAVQLLVGKGGRP